jgi:uncharacterized membrane protein
MQKLPQKKQAAGWHGAPIAKSTVDNAGEVRFVDAPNGNSTEMHVVISYRPPVGDLGKGVAKLFNPILETMIQADLKRFKQIMETGTGELNKSDLQTSGNFNNRSTSGSDSLDVSTTDIKNTIAGTSAQKNV